MAAAIITIDGPSGAGKSTISQALAARLAYAYLDTGAMYRAVGLKIERIGIDCKDPDALDSLLEGIDLQLHAADSETRVILDGEDVTSLIRTPEMSMVASRVSAIPAVRDKLTQLQRKIGNDGEIVAEGRDMGTVVFPQAPWKFFLDATPEERAKRRVLQLQEKGQDVDEGETLRLIIERDEADSSRALAPLKPAEDAIIVDSSKMAIDEVVSLMMENVTKG